MIKVVLDAFGGDNAPLAPIEGALQAIALKEDLHVVLTGDEIKSVRLGHFSIVDTYGFIKKEEIKI